MGGWKTSFCIENKKWDKKSQILGTYKENLYQSKEMHFYVKDKNGNNYELRKEAKVSLPEGTTRIAKCKFYGWLTLEEVNNVENVEIIGKDAFAHTKIQISNNFVNLKEIGNYAFYYSSNTNKNLVIPSSVTTINEGCFCNNAGIIENIYLPRSLKAIGKNAFYFYDEVETDEVNIYFEGTEEEFSKINIDDGYRGPYNKGKTNIIFNSPYLG